MLDSIQTRWLRVPLAKPLDFARGNLSLVSKGKSNGFTLVELLVVISIIALLISMLAPALSGVRSTGKKVTCTNNLRQIGAAMLQWASDYDGYISVMRFPGMPAVGFHSQEDIWTPGANEFRKTEMPSGYLLSYLGENKQVLLCPGTTFAQGLDAFCNTSWSGMDQRGQPGTYQGISPTWWRMVRKVQKNYVLSPSLDKDFGWDKAGSLPVMMDPIIDLGRGQGGWSGSPGGVWDQTGMIIHGNTGTLPILMDDGRVIQFERSQYPPVWGSWVDPDPAIGLKTQVDDILGLL